MSDRWDADVSDATAASWNGEPLLPAPSVTHGPPTADGPFVYGLVAKVALNRPAFGFRVEHDLPPGVDFVEARPKATVVGDHLIWQMGRMDPGQVVRLEVVVRPHPGVVLDPEELAIFEATYSQNLYFQAPVGRARLVARVSGPATATVGEEVAFVVDVASTGNIAVVDGRATVTLPEEFAHPSGMTFTFELGELKPGEFKRITVPAHAIMSGAAILRAEVTGPADRQAVVEFPTLVS